MSLTQERINDIAIECWEKAECNCNELVEALEFAQKKLLESAHPYDEAAMKIGETLAKHKAMMGEEE